MGKRIRTRKIYYYEEVEEVDEDADAVNFKEYSEEVSKEDFNEGMEEY